jgi:hypothetical protein
MEAESRTGRIVGILILVQIVAGVMVNFVLEGPLFGTPGFLVNAALYSRQIALGALLGVITEALWIGIAVTASPLFSQRSRALTLWFAALAVALLALSVVENAAVMSMVSLSEAYAKASAVERGQLETIRVVVASMRNWPHFMCRMIDGCAIFMFYTLVFRDLLIPRVLASFGLIAAVLQVTGVAMPLFGHDVVFPMLAPLGLSQLILATWLIVRGFSSTDRQRQTVGT